MTETIRPKEGGEKIDTPDYKWMFDAGITRIEGLQGQAIQALYVENWFYIANAPGSSGNHQAWPGGYMEHIRQFNSFVEQQYAKMEEDGVFTAMSHGEEFTLSEALAIGALHDIEKPFIYTPTQTGQFVRDPKVRSKEAKAQVRDTLIEYYGIVLTPNQLNAMKYVEGIPDSEYTPGDRIMNPLAALAHMADICSARILYNYSL